MKKNIQVLFLLIIISLLIGSCARRPANYYRKVDIGSRYEIIGRYPIKDDMATKVNCYHFIYNEKGKLVRVEYLKRGKLHNDLILCCENHN